MRFDRNWKRGGVVYLRRVRAAVLLLALAALPLGAGPRAQGSAAPEGIVTATLET